MKAGVTPPCGGSPHKNIEWMGSQLRITVYNSKASFYDLPNPTNTDPPTPSSWFWLKSESHYVNERENHFTKGIKKKVIWENTVDIPHFSPRIPLTYLCFLKHQFIPWVFPFRVHIDTCLSTWMFFQNCRVLTKDVMRVRDGECILSDDGIFKR